MYSIDFPYPGSLSFFFYFFNQTPLLLCFDSYHYYMRNHENINRSPFPSPMKNFQRRPVFGSPLIVCENIYAIASARISFALISFYPILLYF